MSKRHCQSELREMLRQLRGSRSSGSRARIRHHRNDTLLLLVHQAIRALSEAESCVVRAINMAQRHEPVRRRRAA